MESVENIFYGRVESIIGNVGVKTDTAADNEALFLCSWRLDNAVIQPNLMFLRKIL